MTERSGHVTERPQAQCDMSEASREHVGIVARGPRRERGTSEGDT